ncbi:hypothetical protein [Taibaiella chishuiensis]|uniref:Capsule assembly protein Wzi n=1 Tax=Taibaiella chishuiensis TaxID=1434707 RepID=A0A2P8CW92_9BACT|nr:hypothetical protein [Taibaiella chishuiensis]PSK89253.1 hypothetical protein B0I18_11254 [Taibaiella chishuiensis]
MGKRIFLLLLGLFVLHRAGAQNTYLPFGSEEYHLLNRLEALSGSLSNDLFLNVQPVSRLDAVHFLREEKSDFYNAGWSNTDQYNINRALSISGEWLGQNSDGAADSKHPVGIFYRKQPDLVHVNKNDFFLVINPVLGFQGTYERDNARKPLWSTTQGAELRGRFRDRVGFYFFVTNNYEEPVSYARDWIGKWGAIPGAGKYNRSGNGYQYLQFRGYADIALIKDHISLTLGYDKHFIGDGYRSLFLSDFSEGAAFARINTRIWKLNYQNLYTVLKPQNSASQANKYATAHYLSLNLTRWLNIGFFETVTFSREGHYEFGYMNPIIFYRAIERGMGSPDKVALGFNFKALALKRLSLYGQVLINEFSTKEIFSGKGYWANKWGLQGGIKYFDAFTIPNLDLQAEVNIVRPYTYQHYRSLSDTAISNNTHYNQPMAHPLGAGFAELLVLARYQPMPRLAIDAKAMYYKQGVDTGGINYGNNIFLDYQSRPGDYGVSLINGPEASCFLLSLNASYELRPRLYFDLGGTYRKYKVEQDILPGNSNLYFSAGLRLNLARRDYTQF